MNDLMPERYYLSPSYMGGPVSEDVANAAAVAAAAGVEAVQDEQAQAERAAGMEAATVDASMSAELAAEQAQEAAAAATAASEAANAAVDQAGAAASVAGAAVDEAYDARSHVDQLRQDMNAGWADLREFISGRLPAAPDASDQPTEVVVTHESANPAPEQSANAGSDGSVGDLPRPGRHRFGHSRR